jgi:hypothetical protein
MRIAWRVVALFVPLMGCSVAPLTPSASIMSVPIGADQSWPRDVSVGGNVFSVSIVKLIVQPERYQGKRVQVVGFVDFAFEGNHICLSEGSGGRDCLWVDVEGMKDPGFRRGWASIEGTFDAEARGHFACCAGTLTNITSIRKRGGR